MKERDIFIGGAWPYANYYLHIGHLAALLPGDILAKYYRGKGDNVIYVSGSDCHGTPITERARKENVTPKEIATHYHNEFVKLPEAETISFWQGPGKTYDLNDISSYKALVAKGYNIRTRDKSRSWDNKFYLWPIPQTERNKCPWLDQNLGYGE